MTFRGRSSFLSRGGSSREGRESLLLKPDTHRRNSSTDPPGSSSSGASDYQAAAMMKNRLSPSRKSRGSPSRKLSSPSRRLAPQNRFQPQHGAPKQTEIPPDQGVLQFVPAFDESHTANNSLQEASWDAILDEGSTAFPTKGAKSEIAPSSSRFRRKTSQQQPAQRRRPSDAESSVSTSRSKGPRIARLASLFSGSGSKQTTTHNKSTKNNSFGPHNTTDATVPCSPSRSSSSGGYVGWPGTQDKRGQTVAIQSSYEESDPLPPPPTTSRRGLSAAFPEYQDQRERQEMEEWMQSPAFQDISGVMADPNDISGMTDPNDISGMSGRPPSPPGQKADDSLYFEDDHQQQRALHNRNDQLLNDHNPDWDMGCSPSRSTFSSKNSSAYFCDNDVRPMAFPAFGEEKRRQAAAKVMRGMSPQPITEESLALNNSFSPPHRTFNADASRGYRGLMDKTHDVPNLMDAMDSDSQSSNVPSSATSGPPGAYRQPTGLIMPRVREEEHDYNTMARDESESDVFDEISKYSIGDSEPFEGISASASESQSKQSSMYEIRDANPFEGISQNVVEESKASLRELRNTTSSVEKRHQNNHANNPQRNNNPKVGPKVVLLGGGLTTIQTTNVDFSNRISASDFDECLTNSDIDEYGNIRLPSFQEMAAAGRAPHDNASVVDMSVDQSLTSSRDNSNKKSTSFVGSFEDQHSLTSRDNNHIKKSSNQSFGSFEQAPAGRPAHSNSQNIGVRMIGESFAAFEEKKDNHPSQRGNATASDPGGYKDDESAFFSDFYSADEVSFEGDLSKYYVQPSQVKTLVSKYRKMCRSTMSNCRNYDELDRAEDDKKVFALFEMRSRIMEKDIERGLERRGGTSVVDDLVTTPFNRRAMRVRDAVIVSKAWRDGATPIDVINTARLTQRDERSYFIKRPTRTGMPGRSGDSKVPRFHWEEVAWIDDTDFMQYRCPSLGARHLRGTEMYTIGDCQSILLKLTNEACIELREELNDATALQIEAEELMREEGDYGDGMMTESEMIYLSAMEEVKTISRRLVVAEKAFALVRDRIRSLVAKYESLLVKIDNEDMATSSVITAESSCYTEDYDSRLSTDYDEELAWHRRQQRAEVSAELAAREALFAKQTEARAAQDEKHRELQELQVRLAELQSEPSTTTTDRQRSVVLAKAIAAKQQSSKGQPAQQNDNQNSQVSKVDSVKQRFRDRMAARMRQKPEANHSDVGQAAANQQHPGARYFMQDEPPKTTVKSPSLERKKLIRLAGEEMFQHLDFYERSLKAVEISREGAAL